MTRGQGASGYRPGHGNTGLRHAARNPGFPEGAVLDDEDRALLSVYSWSIGSGGYLQRHVATGRGKYTKFRLHRELMGFPDGEVDHINGNKLDNRRANLRVVTRQGNGQNVGMFRTNTSGHLGVSWNKKTAKFQAYGKIDRKMIHLGLFSEREEAARVAAEYRQQNYAGYTGRAA
jgi:hypothetical protein